MGCSTGVYSVYTQFIVEQYTTVLFGLSVLWAVHAKQCLAMSASANQHHAYIMTP